MSFLDRIRACNAHDLANFRPFRIGAEQVGWVRPDVAELLFGLPGLFEAAQGGVRLADRFESFADRTAALAEASVALVEGGFLRKLREEDYGISNVWGGPPRAALNRGAVEAFGARAYGVHVNGWRRAPGGGIEMWVGVRSAEKAVAPGKLDNMVAGGQPIGLGLMENLIKEAAEEASVPEALARTAEPVGCITYDMETDQGLKPDVMFCYDLETPADFTPVNADGETQEFRLNPIEDVAADVAETEDYKFNVNLAIIDFLLRRGVIDPDREPDYAALAAGLRSGRALPGA